MAGEWREITVDRAFVEAYAAHACICSRFVGTSPSLLLGDREARSGLEALESITQHRMRLLPALATSYDGGAPLAREAQEEMKP